MRLCAYAPSSMIGVVIPTLNEAEFLPALLSDLRRVAVPLDVVVADGGSADGTPAAASTAGVRVIAAPRGRAAQMNAGARAVAGRWLLFLHADSRLPPRARRALLTAVVDEPELEVAVFGFAIDLPLPGRRFVEMGQALRQTLFGLPYGDQGLLVRRELFEQVGGFPEVPLLEDVAALRALGRRARVHTLSGTILTSGRRYRRDGVVRTWLRHTAIMLLYSIGVPPHRLLYWRKS
jgi:rSAM/selenodomain-associated transferase 2